MILPDHEIERLALAGMITPFNPDQLNPASYDVRVAREHAIEYNAEARYLVGTQFKIIVGDINLEPGEFILAATMEIFHLPDDITAQFQLKSTWGREGLGHVMAGFCDPGWHGSALTMELKNYLRDSYIKIPIGECVGQMVFSRMESKPRKSYRETGQYNNDITVTEAKR